MTLLGKPCHLFSASVSYESIAILGNHSSAAQVRHCLTETRWMPTVAAMGTLGYTGSAYTLASVVS